MSQQDTGILGQLCPDELQNIYVDEKEQTRIRTRHTEDGCLIERFCRKKFRLLMVSLIAFITVLTGFNIVTERLDKDALNQIFNTFRSPKSDDVILEVIQNATKLSEVLFSEILINATKHAEEASTLL